MFKLKINTNELKQNKIIIFLIVFIILIAGVKLLTLSHATGPYTSAEAESGVRSGTTIYTDSSASGGSAVRFGSANTGTTYYVSASGSDSNSGTSQSSPWQTIAHVNSHTFSAGQSILFEGGSTFSGNLTFTSSEAGTSTSPITIGSYGSGLATINGGNGSAIIIDNTQGYDVNNLNLVGSGTSTNTGDGINIYNSSSTNETYFYITNVSSTGFENGLSVDGTNSGTDLSNITVTHSTFYGNGRNGIVTFGPIPTSSSGPFAISNMVVSYVTAYNNIGDPSLTGTNNSGNGVDLGSTNNSTIEYSSAYDNGASCTDSACGVGLWGYDSNNLTIEHNVSYDNQTGSSADGDGFDFDENTSNSTMEYNYSYGNAGSGFLLFGVTNNNLHTNNTVRYNISQNDGRKNSYGGIETYGNVSGDSIYNNTVYMSKPSSGTPFPLEVYTLGSGLTTIRNNIFEVGSGLSSVAYVSYAPSTSSLEMQSNDYYPMSVYYGSTNYTSLSNFQSSTGQEKNSGSSIGFAVNPDLTNAGSGTLITDPTTLSTLSQYKLVTGSPLINTGLKLNSVFGTNTGGVDFYGVTVPSSSGQSVGAAQ